MTLSTWLKISAIGLPLVGALAIWRWGDRSPLVPRWLAAIIFGFMGLDSLALFLFNRYYTCIFASGSQNCLFDGLATLSLLILSILLARSSFGLKGANKDCAIHQRGVTGLQEQFWTERRKQGPGICSAATARQRVGRNRVSREFAGDSYILESVFVCHPSLAEAARGNVSFSDAAG